MSEDELSDGKETDESARVAPSTSAKLGLLIVGGIAIAGIVLMCLTVLLLVLLGDD